MQFVQTVIPKEERVQLNVFQPKDANSLSRMMSPDHNQQNKVDESELAQSLSRLQM